MKILALESSAVAASAALCEDEMLLGQTYLHTGLTHSQTLLPMAADGLGVTIADRDAYTEETLDVPFYGVYYG